MGMFDEISVYGMCPYCGRLQTFEAQTKDLSNSMWRFNVYRVDRWFDRTKIGVFPKTPQDREQTVWKSQDERRRAMATVPEEFRKLKYVEVTADCRSPECMFYADRRDILRQGCPSGFGRCFEGKIRVVKGLLVGNIIGAIFDIKKTDNLCERRLNQYRKRDPAKLRKLLKKFKFEPFAVRHWHEFPDSKGAKRRGLQIVMPSEVV
jgi:hypothetical protein